MTLVTGNKSFGVDNVDVMEVTMNVNVETKMKDIALSNPTARQVLEDAGLDYC